MTLYNGLMTQDDDVIPICDYAIYFTAWKERFGDDMEGVVKTAKAWDMLVRRMTPAQFHKCNSGWGRCMEEWNGLVEGIRVTETSHPLYAWAAKRIEALDRDIAFIEAKLLLAPINGD